MTTHYENWSGETLGDYTTRASPGDNNLAVVSPKAPTGWTWWGAATGAQKLTMAADVGSPTGRYLRFNSAGGTVNNLVYWSGASSNGQTAPGTAGVIADSSIVECLACWRLKAAVTITNTGGEYPIVFHSVGSFTAGIDHYQLRDATNLNAGLFIYDLHEEGTGVKIAASNMDITNVETLVSATTTDWYWGRTRVDASGVMKFKVWRNGQVEPPFYSDGGADVTATDTSRLGGYVGFAVINNASIPFDLAYFAVGVGGDPAPSIGGGAGGTAARAMDHYRRQRSR